MIAKNDRTYLQDRSSTGQTQIKGKLIAPQKYDFSLICVIIYTLLLISSSYEIRNKSKSCQTRDHQCQNIFAVTCVLKLFPLMIQILNCEKKDMKNCMTPVLHPTSGTSSLEGLNGFRRMCSCEVQKILLSLFCLYGPHIAGNARCCELQMANYSFALSDHGIV